MKNNPNSYAKYFSDKEDF